MQEGKMFTDALGRKQKGFFGAKAENCHVVSVRGQEDHHGFPFVPQCECGWRARGFVTPAAAWILADEHIAEAKLAEYA